MTIKAVKKLRKFKDELDKLMDAEEETKLIKMKYNDDNKNEVIKLSKKEAPDSPGLGCCNN